MLNLHILAIMKDGDISNMWIGYHDTDKENNFVWTDGTKGKR